MKKILISPYTYIGLVFIIFVFVAISNTYAWFNWQSTDDLRFEVKIGNVTPPVFDGTVNRPSIQSGLIPIKYDGTNWVNANPNNVGNDWYNYMVQGGTTTTGGTSRWANSLTINGDFLVWIPRFEYKITSGYHSATAGTIDVKFIPVTQIVADDGYIIHPAFRNDSTIGGWDKELEGFWVGKFENSNDGNGNIKIIPNAIEYASLPIADFITKSQEFGINNNLIEYDSHLIKNSEWGAIVYLAHSQYGRNGIEVTYNNHSSLKTGYGGYIIKDTSTTTERSVLDNTSTSGTFPYNNTYRGVLASTTGNVYGVYDMNGGGYEYINAYYSTNCTNVVDAKYKNCYTGYSAAIYGDAIYETSLTKGWFNSEMLFPNSSNPWLRRASMFGYNYRNGGASPNTTSRVVVTP